MLVEKRGVVAIPITMDGRILALVDKQKENGHKQERLGWDPNSVRMPIVGKRQFTGGVAEDGEINIDAAAREASEETLLEVTAADLIPMGVSTLIDHERHGHSDLYGVEIFLWMVNECVERQLLTAGAVEVDEDVTDIRVRDQIVIQLYRERSRELVVA